MNFLRMIFGDINAKEVKKIEKIVEKIEALEPKMQALKDSELTGMTDALRGKLEGGASEDDILPEAFAVAREASVRVLGKRPFRVQLIGAVVVHQGRIAEMKTGEGKTLVATMPAYLNALSGKGVHIVTVNDYLAMRDREWMGKIFEFLGMSVGVIINGLEPSVRRREYAADITYGTNAQFGFDYLRDNMVVNKDKLVQRKLNFAIVDEVDSILIDEARTPLIISGETTKATDLYQKADRFARTLARDIDVKVDEKDRTVSLTDGKVVDKYGIEEEGSENRNGVKKAEEYFGIDNLSDSENMEISHHIKQAITANFMMKRDVDYIVKDGEILIVDQFTGRLMYGRRYSNGLHQAIEAKEGIEIRAEDQTLATITIQNYFRMYNKLSGMTGTAKTEEDEFKHTYGMDVVVIPTNLPIQRKDFNDQIYNKIEVKLKFIIRGIKECYEKGQPVLVGTVNIETSELISQLLKREGVKHEILNAKHHEREAEIVAQAGRFGSVTIATNMAGRGTDIILGGNPEFMAKKDMLKEGYTEHLISLATSPLETSDPEVKEAREKYEAFYKIHEPITKENAEKVKAVGGLHIIGTERHESRRIDNQLRGRAGRQGDAGSSRFYISLEDDLMRLFMPERVLRMTENLDEDSMPIEMGLITRNVEMVQKKIEGRHFASRKAVLEYDDVINKQREIIYGQRRSVLDGDDIKDSIISMIDITADSAVALHTGGHKYPEDWDIPGLQESLQRFFTSKFNLDIPADDSWSLEKLGEEVRTEAHRVYDQKESELTSGLMRIAERDILLMHVDRLWVDHISDMDELRQGISLRAFGQQDPVQAYKQEGFEMFEALIADIRSNTVGHLMSLNLKEEIESHERVSVVKNATESGPVIAARADDKVGRNAPCPCGSGKKYKRCCGRN